VSAFLTARTVPEALEALATGARPIAGGTDLVVNARGGQRPLPDRLVAIHRLDALRTTDLSADTLRLGALTTHREIAHNGLVKSRLTALADASAIIGSVATRAQGTIGGNVMNASPAMDTGGPLICFDARVTLQSTSGTRSVAVAELFAGPGRTTAREDELLTVVEIAVPPAGSGSCYLRLEYRRQMEIAVVGATAVITLHENTISSARVAITALAPTIRRVPTAEGTLIGTAGDADTITAAAQAAADAATPISDVRASEAYRRAMAAVIARRVIDTALARARGQEDQR
jgi:CO/xanthine dehydrogenase FAD-binding subunit